jgi:hypothetical protein
VTYEQEMSDGEREYRDVLAALHRAGIPASFTQTGGMNAALDATLEGGAFLLVTGTEGSLPWRRAYLRGWTVGVYANDGSPEPIAIASTGSAHTTALLGAVRQVLGARPPSWRPRIRPRGVDGVCPHPAVDSGRGYLG